MPNIKSAEKRVLVTKAKALNNKMVKSNLKTYIKKAEAAIEANDANKTDAVRLAIKKIDQCCAKGIIAKNTAARRKSALALKLNKVG
ncbi:MAG: 30S ribosomal protein S20 [Oscillospiraceae bacterium]|nr:30S ribosomal protein S20 [Oscillospiraceae bacterium]MBQ3049403.1 30S ribosomal protein S20 [Oscillospiraceae bacterium]MBQ9939562.1 30S ribosomal protein S20 [Oscillospiraceae bacterium]